MLKFQVNLGGKENRVQYELYIDVFFLVNFLLDYLVLRIVKRMLRCTATRGRILTGAIMGALSASILVCVPIHRVIKIILLHTVISTIMLKITFGIKKRDFLKKWILLYLTGILMGGVLTSISQYIGPYFRVISLFFAVVICSYFVVIELVGFFERYFQITTAKCRVLLYLNDTICEVSAIKDTGNMLIDQITGKPVHVISNHAMKKLTESTKEEMLFVRYIPYHTVQGDSKVMPLIKIDKMRICGEEEIEVRGPLLGISECAKFGDGEYEMILHPKDLREG